MELAYKRIGLEKKAEFINFTVFYGLDYSMFLTQSRKKTGERSKINFGIHIVYSLDLYCNCVL
jgi:hypothetical protein